MTESFDNTASGPARHTHSAVEQIRTMFDYSIWARDKLLDAISSVEEESLRGAQSGGVYGSIHDTLAHLAASQWLWLRRCNGESPVKRVKGEDFPDLRALLAWWDDTQAEAMRYIDTLHDEDLEREITYLGPDGKERTRKVWHMLLQVTNHQTEHRAQIGTMLGQMGIEVPQTDLVVYLSEEK